MSTFFPDAQNLTITGGVISHVEGDQHNYYRQRISQASEASTSSSPFASSLGPIAQATSSSTTTTTVQINGNQYNQIIQREEKAHTEFDDFRNVKRGDIYRIRNICQVLGHCKGHQWWEECQCPREVIKTFCTAKLIGVEGEFTTVNYSGRDAQKVFEEEFLKLSRIQFAEASQVFAIANGTIPSMVLWHNLIPLAQFKEHVGRWGFRYLESLRRQLGCRDEELWIDSSRGVICHGPKGPSSSFPGYWLKFKDLPPTAELLQDEVLLRFLGCQKSREADDAFMGIMFDTGIDKNVPKWVDRPTIFSALTKTPIAVTNNVWTSSEDNLVERTCLENGWTRFRLDGDGWPTLDLNKDINRAWLSQTSSVFHARGVSLDNDLEDFYLVYPTAWLRDYVDDSPSKRQLRRQQPIYLFVYPPPTPPTRSHSKTSSLHHWSFQEDGHSHISPESCFHLGLPVELEYLFNWSSPSWPRKSYKSLHQYQIARGLDPTTADLARHLAYPIFQPLDDSDRFEDVQKDDASTCSAFSFDLGESFIAIEPDESSLLNTQDHTPVGSSSIISDTPAIIDTTDLGNVVTDNTQMASGETGTQNYPDACHRDNARTREGPPSHLIQRNPHPAPPFTPISLVSRGLATFLPSRNSVEVLSSSFSNISATGMLRSLISADKPPASRHGQRHLIRMDEAVVSTTVARSEGSEATRLA
ncbi:hypothetical protein PQX77_013924 [Marasmius sp. AFHP31]|nr:hypothetical protein PQX77_013924 [Marasmius sp. AFHP31]